MDNIQYENKNYLENQQQNLNMGRNNLYSTFSKDFPKKILNGIDEEQKIKFKNNYSKMNENDLFSLTKDNFFNTGSTFYIKDYFNNDNLNRDNNNINSISSINVSSLDRNYNNNIFFDKKSKSEIDIKYNYYLSDLNKERNNETDNIIQKNENIQKLLEEEKNIEEENLKRLNELRVKYLSSIKTFDVPLEENYRTNNGVENLKARTERRDILNNDINEYYSNLNSKNKNSSFSMSNKLFKQNSSFNDIIQTPINLNNKPNDDLIKEEKNFVKNNLTNYMSNILSSKDYNNKSNYEQNNDISNNKIINKMGSISNQNFNEDFDTIEKKSENENDNYIQNNLKEIKNNIKEENINKSYN